MNPVNPLKTMALVLAITVLATACTGGSESSADDLPSDTTLAFDDSEIVPPAGASSEVPTSEAATTTEQDDTTQAPDVETDRPCDGHGFPDDEEFREALCAIQWTQLDLMRTGGQIDPSWIERTTAAILGYATDRAGSLQELADILTEMNAAMPGATPNPPVVADADDVEQLQADTANLRDCMVEVGRLIIEANVSAGFDPTTIDQWQADVDEIDALVDAGDLGAAEAAVCALRTEIAAAVADPSLVPSN